LTAASVVLNLRVFLVALDWTHAPAASIGKGARNGVIVNTTMVCHKNLCGNWIVKIKKEICPAVIKSGDAERNNKKGYDRTAALCW